jgi:phosphatidylinositol alpha-1,6-mannosyltransferase
MRILVFTFQFPPRVGGVESMAYQLTKYLAQAGTDIQVLTQDEAGAIEFDRQQRFPIYRIRLGSTDNVVQRVIQKIKLLAIVQRVVRDYKPDYILCIHWDPCGYLLQILSGLRLIQCPYFLIAHGMELLQLPRSNPSRWAKALLRWLALRGARKLFSVSGFTQNQVLSLGVLRERVLVIPNGVEMRRDEDEIAQTQRSQRSLLTVARLVPRKGHDTVLQALPRVIQRVPDLVYRVVGTGPERNRLEQMAARLGLAERVQFYGAVTDEEKNRLLAECEIFVMPCRETPTDFEGFGIVYLEAMQFGKAVVASRSGGVIDIVQDQVTGVLVPPDDPVALANALVDLLENPQQARRLGENARRVVREKYRWDLIAERYLAEMSV